MTTPRIYTTDTARNIATIILIGIVSLFADDSFADCASAPETVYVTIPFAPSTASEVFEPGVMAVDGCEYKIPSSDGTFAVCATEEEDEGEVSCLVLLEKVGDNALIVTSPIGTRYVLEQPIPGCGLVETPTGTTNLCSYDGEYNAETDEQEVPTGWNEKEPGIVVPGFSGSVDPSLDIVAANTDDEGCPEGYTSDGFDDTGNTCVLDSIVVAGLIGYIFTPNSDTGAETEGAPDEEPPEEDGEGVDICVEHPDIIACLDKSELDDTGADYDETDYQDAIGDGIDLPDVTLDPSDILPESDGSCQTIELEFLTQSSTFPSAYICGIFDTGRTIAEYGFYLLTAIGVFFLIIKETV